MYIEVRAHVSRDSHGRGKGARLLGVTYRKRSQGKIFKLRKAIDFQVLTKS